MNCKQGDLAIIVGSVAAKEGKEGLIIRVLSCGTDPDHGVPSWTYEGNVIHPSGIRYRRILDCFLRPIRDPGDDAVDEVIQRIGSPNKQEQAA